MKKVPFVIVTLVLLSVLALAFNAQNTKAQSIAISDEIALIQQELVLETDKRVYVLGENVTILLKNVGDENVDIAGYPAWQIFTYPKEEPVYPRIFATLAWSLGPGENNTFIWNQYNDFSESFCQPGTYVIRDTQGWNLTANFRIVWLIGDINGDKKVDVADLVLFVKAFGTYPGSPRWNPNADLNMDDKVSIEDLVLLMKHFGEYYP